MRFLLGIVMMVGDKKTILINVLVLTNNNEADFLWHCVFRVFCVLTNLNEESFGTKLKNPQCGLKTRIQFAPMTFYYWGTKKSESEEICG